MNKLICLFFIAALTYSGINALSCYDCDAKTEQECQTGAKVAKCGKAAPGYENVCYYRKGYDNYLRTYRYTAKCGVRNQYTKELNDCQSNQYFTIYHCNQCHNDQCNDGFWANYWG